MISSGPRRFKYRAGLDHTGDDGRVSHCQSRWHFRCRRVPVFVFGQKTSFDHDLSLSKQGFQQCLWQAAGVVMPAPIFRRGAVRVGDERTNLCLSLGHRPLAEANGSFVVRQALSPALPKKNEKLVEFEAQWRSPCR